MAHVLSLISNLFLSLPKPLLFIFGRFHFSWVLRRIGWLETWKDLRITCLPTYLIKFITSNILVGYWWKFGNPWSCLKIFRSLEFSFDFRVYLLGLICKDSYEHIHQIWVQTYFTFEWFSPFLEFVFGYWNCQSKLGQVCIIPVWPSCHPRYDRLGQLGHLYGGQYYFGCPKTCFRSFLCFCGSLRCLEGFPYHQTTSWFRWF